MEDRRREAKPDQATGAVARPCYRLRLFVAGEEPNSVRARAILQRLCATHLQGRCELEIVDVFADYQAAIKHKVFAVPALVVEAPPPLRTIVGSLSEEAKVLAALGLSSQDGNDAQR